MRDETLSVSPVRPLSGTISLPGDKSLSHRAALFAAMAEGISVIDRFLDSGVTRVMLHALKALGVEWELRDNCRLVVTGRGLHGFKKPLFRLHCGNSATTIRMLAGALAASGTPCTLDGFAGLRKRPMNRIVEPLRLMGELVATPNGCAPMTLPGRDPDRPLRPLHYALSIASAQVKSCLILAALSASGDSVIFEPGPSRDHTERMLASMGAPVRTIAPQTIRVSPLRKPLAPLVIELPGDISSAAFLIVAALLVPGSSVTIRDIGLNRTRTGILDALRGMGAKITVQSSHVRSGEPVGDLLVEAAPLRGIRIGDASVVRMIDEIPVLAVAACFAEGRTEIREAGELRYKETDRIASLCRELTKLGARVEEKTDGLVIHGGTLRGGDCDSCGDHRLAMALTVAGLASPQPVTVHHAQAVRESFPGFTDALHSLGVGLN